MLFLAFDQVINVGTEFDVHADSNDAGLAIGFTLGEFRGGKLIVDIPSSKQGAVLRRLSPASLSLV